MGHGGRAWNTHCEVRYVGVRVPVGNTLGERGEAFRLAQKRLGAGRIHHVMRWLGQMQRAFDLTCCKALEREAFGGPLADKQTVQNWIADSAASIQACRLLTMDAARKIDEGSEARVDVSLLKFYAAGALNDVIDRAIQVHGARGLTDATPLRERWRCTRGRGGSTTAPTRSTGWSSPAASSSPSAKARAGRSRRRFADRVRRVALAIEFRLLGLPSGRERRRQPDRLVAAARPGERREAEVDRRAAGLDDPGVAGLAGGRARPMPPRRRRRRSGAGTRRPPAGREPCPRPSACRRSPGRSR